MNNTIGLSFEKESLQSALPSELDYFQQDPSPISDAGNRREPSPLATGSRMIAIVL